MIGDEHDDAAADDDDDRVDRIPGREQVQPGQRVDDRRGERDHRCHRSNRADRRRIGQSRSEIHDAEQQPFGESDQHQPIHGAVHGGDHMAGDPLAPQPNQSVAQAAQLRDQRVAVAKQKEQGQQREQKQRQAVHHFGAILADRFGESPQIDSTDQLFGSDRIAEVAAPPFSNRGTDERQLIEPSRGRNPVVARVVNELDDEVALVGHRDADQDDRRNEDDANEGRRDRRRHHPIDRLRYRLPQPAINRPERDREHRRPDERRQKVAQDP